MRRLTPKQPKIGSYSQPSSDHCRSCGKPTNYLMGDRECMRCYQSYAHDTPPEGNKMKTFRKLREDIAKSNSKKVPASLEGMSEDDGGAAPANNAGGGNIAGIGVGPQGEPGVSPLYQRKRKQLKLMNGPAVDPRLFADKVYRRKKPVMEAEPSPIVKDYLKHVHNAVNATGAINVQKHLNKARSTHASMNAKGKREVETHLPDAHRQWLHRINMETDL